MLNFSCDEVQWKGLSHIVAHGISCVQSNLSLLLGGINCSDKRSFTAEKLNKRNKKGKNKATYYYPPNCSKGALLRTREEVWFLFGGDTSGLILVL